MPAVEQMILKFHLALFIWEGARLEPGGEVRSLNERSLPAAKEAMDLWNDVVNTYHNKVREKADELGRWPMPDFTAHQMCKDAVASSFRAHAAIER